MAGFRLNATWHLMPLPERRKSLRIPSGDAALLRKWRRMKANGIKYADGASHQDARGDATVATHRVVSAMTQLRLHARARITTASNFKDRLSANGPLQRNICEERPHAEQVDARDDKVASQAAGIQRLQAKPSRDAWQMLSLKERDFPLLRHCVSAKVQGPSIPNQTAPRLGLSRSDRNDGRQAGGAQEDRFDAARTPKLMREVTQTLDRHGL